MNYEKYNSLSHKDGYIKLAPVETDYLLWLLKSILDANQHLEDKETVQSIVNKLEFSRGKG